METSKRSKDKKGRFCRGLVFAKELLRHTFFKTDFESEKRSLEEKLLTKGWIWHCFMSLTRIISFATGTAYWQKAYEVDKFPEGVDEAFVDKTQSTVQAIYLCVIVLGPILDIVVWRKRQLGVLLFYFELVPMCLLAATPLNYGEFKELLSCLYCQYTYMVMAVNTKGHVCSCILVYTACIFVITPQVYQEEVLTAGKIYFKLMNVSGVLVFITVFSALTTYISRIESKLKRLMLQNLGLLDGMHEGIIVLADDDKNLEFANMPAIELINKG